MDDVELKNMIWQKFGPQLKAHGITEIEFKRRDAPPKASELPKGTFLVKLGVVGKYAVWLVKGAVYALTLFVTLANIPDAHQKFKVYYPKTYEYAMKTIDYFRENPPSYRPEYNTHKELHDSYVVIDNDWKKGRQFFEQDSRNIGSTDYLTGIDRPLTFVSSSCTPLEYTTTGHYASAVSSVSSTLGSTDPLKST